MNIKPIYNNTPIAELVRTGIIDRNIARACESATPPLTTAGDIRRYLSEHGSFTEVPGCRRPGRISRALTTLAGMTLGENSPEVRTTASLAETADFPFLTAEQRAAALDFKAKHGRLPMFAILAAYLQREGAGRDDRIFGIWTGLTGEGAHSLAEIGLAFNLTAERVRQLILDYTIDNLLTNNRLWQGYADYSTYFLNENSDIFATVVASECPGLDFRGFGAVMRRIHSLDMVDNRFLARRGWAPEIEAWLLRLERLRDMPRTISSRISIDGLTMGGKLDSRLKLVVINQIVPALGLKVMDDNILLPANTSADSGL